MSRDLDMRLRLNAIMVGQAEDYFPNDTDVQIMRKQVDEIMEKFGIEQQMPAGRRTPAPQPQIMEFDDSMMPKKK
jgi:hypothetical protein